MSPLAAAQTPAVPYAAERVQVEGQIFALQEQIRELSRGLNQLTPVGHLSSELLVEIFSYLTCDSYEDPHSQEDVPFTLRITHVSHRWRAVALGCSALWNKIFFPQKGYVQEWLKRAHSSNLSIWLYPDYSDEALQLVFGQFHRTRHLDVEVGDEEDALRLFQFPDTPADILSTLTIRCNTLEPTFSLSFLSRSFSSLRYLSIRSCGNVDLTSTIFTNLTTLHVVDCSIEIDLPALVSQLQGMSRLRELRLSTISLSPMTNSEDIPIIKLTCLLKLEYGGTQGFLDFLLLSRIKFSKDPALNIAFTTELTESPESLLTSPTLTRIFKAFKRIWSGSTPIHKFQLHFNNDDNLLVFRTPHTHIRIKSLAVPAVYDAYMTWMVKNRSTFTNLRDLTVTGPINDGFWTLIPKLRSLRSIKVHGTGSEKLLNLFVENWEMTRPTGPVDGTTSESEVKPRLVLPKLQVVSLEYGLFTDVSKELVDALKYRRDHKHQIMSLIIGNCFGLWVGLIEQLSDVVGKVDWDGVGEDDSDESEDEDSEDNEEDDEDGGESEEDDDDPTTLCEGCGDVLYCDNCN